MKDVRSNNLINLGHECLETVLAIQETIPSTINNCKILGSQSAKDLVAYRIACLHACMRL